MRENSPNKAIKKKKKKEGLQETKNTNICAPIMCQVLCWVTR